MGLMIYRCSNCGDITAAKDKESDAPTCCGEKMKLVEGGIDAFLHPDSGWFFNDSLQ